MVYLPCWYTRTRWQPTATAHFTYDSVTPLRYTMPLCCAWCSMTAALFAVGRAALLRAATRQHCCSPLRCVLPATLVYLLPPSSFSSPACMNICPSSLLLKTFPFPYVYGCRLVYIMLHSRHCNICAVPLARFPGLYSLRYYTFLRAHLWWQTRIGRFFSTGGQLPTRWVRRCCAISPTLL